MKSPLALLEIDNSRDKPGRVWKVVRSARAARGYSAYRALWLRRPTSLEVDTVNQCLLQTKGQAYHLDRCLS